MHKKPTEQSIRRNTPRIIHPVEKGVVPAESDLIILSPDNEIRQHLLYPLRIGRFTYAPGFHLTRNRFDSFLFGTVLEGEQHVIIWEDNTPHRYHVKAGNAFLFDTYRPHEAWTDVTTRTSMIHFDGPSARFYYERIINRAGATFPLSNAAFLYNSVDRLMKEYSHYGPDTDLIGARVLTDMLTDLTLMPHSDSTDGILAVRETVSFITSHLTEDLTITALAQRATMSTRHFSRQFEAVTGSTPHAYITSLRMDKARRLLANSSMPIKQIAAAVGYAANPATFVAAFKRSTGVTPTQYRAQHTE